MRRTPKQTNQLFVTLNALRVHSPCSEGWRKLTNSLPKDFDDNAPIPIAHIVQSNGVSDAVWAFRAISSDHATVKNTVLRHLAVGCAEHVLPLFEKRYPNNKNVRNCIAVTKKFLAGKATIDELREARKLAYAYAYAAADAAAAAAAAAYAYAYAYAAADAAAAAADARKLERIWQGKKLISLLKKHTI